MSRRSRRIQLQHQVEDQDQDDSEDVSNNYLGRLVTRTDVTTLLYLTGGNGGRE